MEEQEGNSLLDKMKDQEANSLPDIEDVITDLEKRGLPLLDFEFLSMQPSREPSGKEGNEQKRESSITIPGFFRKRSSKKDKTNYRDSGRSMSRSPSKKKQQEKMCLTLNKSTYNLEYNDGEETKKINLHKFLYFKLINDDQKIPGIEINSESISYEPRPRTLYFKNIEDRELLIRFLEHFKKKKKEFTYSNDLLPHFLNWELGKQCTPGSAISAITPQVALAYFTRKGVHQQLVERGRLTANSQVKIDKQIGTFEWQTLYASMVEMSSSVFLMRVFKRYSTWEGDNTPRLMSVQNLNEFLSRNQQETIELHETTKIMTLHIDKVS